MWLLGLFIAIPLIEIALFIQVGGAIGLWPTLLIVVLTAFLGSHLVRSQGAAEMTRLRSSFSQLNDPTEPLAHGAMILFSGALLLTPGFFTDIVGFSLLVPGVRSRVFQWLKSKVNVQSFTMGQPPNTGPNRPQHPDDHVIDGEFTEVDPNNRATHSPSGWTRH
ncbi:FxsA family protein [Aestuariibius sp. HNIBRBA575]|uniref:FxsA family protein n=1 Tax=Aestuariibius sp. HNIBRBA575 TaxID=3233343 RepID=UPI0034A58225